MSLYTATSLNDIAEHFERMAKDAEDRVETSITKRIGRDHEVEAYTWTSAARMIRDTTMVTAPTYKNVGEMETFAVLDPSHRAEFHARSIGETLTVKWDGAHTYTIGVRNFVARNEALRWFSDNVG